MIIQSDFLSWLQTDGWQNDFGFFLSFENFVLHDYSFSREYLYIYIFFSVSYWQSWALKLLSFATM